MAASPWKEFFRSCYKNLNFMIGAIMLLSIIIIAVFADYIAPFEYDENDVSAVLQPPSATLGTDKLGRDLWSRIVYGTRIAFKVAAIGGAIQLFLGVVVGLFCGYYGGIVDRSMLFFADLTWCVPGMVMALAVVTILGSNLTNAIIAIALVNWASMARTVRAKTMSLKNMAFIETGITKHYSCANSHVFKVTSGNNNVHDNTIFPWRRISAPITGLGTNGFGRYNLYNPRAVVSNLSWTCVGVYRFEFLCIRRGTSRLT